MLPFHKQIKPRCKEFIQKLKMTQDLLGSLFLLIVPYQISGLVVEQTNSVKAHYHVVIVGSFNY